MHPLTVVEAAARYLEEITPAKAPKTRRQDDLYARKLFSERVDPDGRPLPPLLDPHLPVDALSPPVVHKVHRALQGTPVLANRVLSFLSQVSAHAEVLGARPPNSNPTRAIRRHPERPRTLFLSAPQRKSFLEACWCAAQRGEVTVSAACVCLLLLLAGLRFHEATDLRWDEVDLVAGVIRLRPREERPSLTNKTGEDVARPISDEVVAVLRTMPRWSPFVAPNPRTRRPYVDVRKAMRRICELAGLDRKTTRHALRHSFGTALAEADFTAVEIAAWMGQSSASSAERYIHLAPARLRRDAPRVGAAVRGERRGGAPW